jgi:dihydrolipoamide dehydrogenase
MHEHDLVVIGAGPGGYVAAIRAAQLGMNVACVERESALGGTCLRIGCIPSKALLESSHVYEAANQDLARHGVSAGNVSLDLQRLLGRKQQIVDTLARGVDTLVKKSKITRYRGHGRIERPGRVVVNGDNEPQQLKTKHILIATGSKPASLPGVKFDATRIGTSTEALSYDEVPEHLVVIGAGYIGLELGTVWRRLGARVTVLEYLDRILPGTDAETAREAYKILEKQGLNFRLECRVTAARVENGRCVVVYGIANSLSNPHGGTKERATNEKSSETETQRIGCDRVLVAVGRVPNTGGLGLDGLDIDTDDRGTIVVDDRFRASADGVYAIGDCTGGPMLAHKAQDEGIACVEGIATGYGHVNYAAIPSVVYTYPEIASVGMTEEQLQQSGREFRKGLFPLRANSRARILGVAEGFVKILTDRRTDRILGAHIIAPNAGDLIAEATAAIEFGAGGEDLSRLCHAHPTISEAVKEAALATQGRGIHV